MQSDKLGRQCIKHVHGNPEPASAGGRRERDADEYKCDANGPGLGNGSCVRDRRDVQCDHDLYPEQSELDDHGFV